MIEIAVVLVIIGVLLAFAAPSITAWVRNTQVRNVATSLQAGLHRARSEAIRRNVQVSFSLVTTTATLDNTCALTNTGASWVVSRQNPAGQCATDVSETAAPRIVEKHAGAVRSGDITVAATDGGGAASSAVVFNGFGRVVNGNAITQIQVASAQGADNNMRLLIGVGGTVQMCIVSAALLAANDPRACP